MLFSREIFLWVGVLMSLTNISMAQDFRQEVTFLTVRDLGSGKGPSPYFGDSRATLRAGFCTVRHADTGRLASVFESGPAFLKEQLLNVEQVAVLPLEDVLAKHEEAHNAPPALYVHGYFIDFEKGCRRSALLQQNARLDDRMVSFSWPSDGDLANYARDEADLYWSVIDIADAIVDLNARAGEAKYADVIGHSLGGRGVVLALAEIASRYPEERVGHVVLLAPDMDFEIFVRLWPRISRIAKGFTIYVSDEDRPLAVSAQLHGYQRLGQAGNDVSSLDGVEVIDVSMLPDVDASGHLYHIHDARVGDDLNLLLNQRLAANERAGLTVTGTNTWSILQN